MSEVIKDQSKRFPFLKIVLRKIIYLILALTGCIVSPQIIWSIADIFNGLMAVPNLFALFVLRREVEFPECKIHSNRRTKLRLL